MLAEYDALPFGLLRHGTGQATPVAEAPSKFVHCCPPPKQKVMPLDKVGHIHAMALELQLL